jgi:peptide/nickel transport system substrate-binding protein
MTLGRIGWLPALAALLVGLVLTAAPAAANESTADLGITAVDPTTTAVVGEQQEPACLNVYLVCGLPSQAANAVLAGAYRQKPDFTYEPVLVESVTVDRDPFTLTYRLKQEATWSDGVPVSADDLVFTLEALQNPANDVFSRAGYDQILFATKIDAKTVRLIFRAPVPTWKSLFPQVLPKHALAGQDFDTTLLDSIPVASGPFAFDSWEKGTQLTLTRNANWWGPHAAYLPRVVFRFMPFPNARIQALIDGDVTLLHEQPMLQLLDLPAHGIDVSRTPSQQLEHLFANVESPSMPLLAERWFRQALAHALDRDGGVDVAFGDLSPGLPTAQSLVHLSQQPAHTPHMATYDYDPARVSELMLANGCVLGSDGVWSCGGTRASVRFTTTTNNPLRLAVQSHFQQKALAAGIELVADNSPASVLFPTRLPARTYELVMFTLIMSGDASHLGSVYGCEGDQDFSEYCSSQVTALTDAAEVEVDDATRAALGNQVDDLLADDVPALPLFQRPTFLAHRPTLCGVVGSATSRGVTWNVEEWFHPSANLSAAPPPNGVIGRPFSFRFESDGRGPLQDFTVASGTLPPGVTLRADGVLSGTPTHAGTFAFGIEAARGCGGTETQESFTVTVREQLAVTTSTLDGGTVGTPYSETLEASGLGGLSTAWSVTAGSLPTGLAVAPDGVISGTPTAAGAYTFTVKVSDVDGYLPDRSGTKELTLTIVAQALEAAAPACGASIGVVGTAYCGVPPSVTGGRGPYRWALEGAAPPGLAVDGATGSLAGTPTTAGRFAYALGVTDADGRTASVALSLGVVDALRLDTARLDAGEVGDRYLEKLASSNGVAPITWAVTGGELPPGLELGPTSGVLKGKPRTAGTWEFVVTVSDVLGQESSRTLKLRIRR